MNIKTIATIGSVFLLAACNSTTATAPAAPQASAQTEHALGLKRVWMLDEWPEFSRAKLHRYKAEMDLTRLPHASAYMGCNRMMFQLATANPSLQSGTFSVGPVASTRKLCMDQMDLEQAFGKSISKFTHYRLDGHRLILSNEKGETARFVAQDWD